MVAVVVDSEEASPRTAKGIATRAKGTTGISDEDNDSRMIGLLFA